MMKKLTLTLFLIVNWSIFFAQSLQNVDNFKNQLSQAKDDKNRVLIMQRLVWAYQFTNPDSALFYGKQAKALADKIEFLDGKVAIMGFESTVYIGLGNLPKALELGLKALQIADSNQITIAKAVPLNAIGLVYLELKDYPKSLAYFQQMKAISELDTFNIDAGLAFAELNIGMVLEETNQLDSATYYLNKSNYHFKKIGNSPFPVVSNKLGNIQVKLGKYQLALADYNESIRLALINTDHGNLSLTYTQIARLYKKLGKRDSSIYYAQKGLAEAETITQRKGILEAASFLSELYDSIAPKEALHYYKVAANAKESLFGAGNIQAIQEMVKQVEERQKEAKTAKVFYQNRLKQYALLSGLGIMFLIGFILYRNNRQKQKANIVLENTLSNLKSTQAQLIQKEKLASLGELTAGIAHEIQNPLNFVNNFSELSVDLVKDLKDELKRPDKDETYIDELFDDLSQNQEKINHHGKRASSIVKGMLEHSRASTGVKELTDINKLADEYLRLSYHGLRAKDKDFNAEFKTDFDENLPKIEVIPQDIGRVLLNLINNAFYAVSEKKKNYTGGYHPTVIVSTKQVDNQIIIKVKDNGIGMSDATKAKVFQPFFTTKPTGQGTGLGLSLAYDIITKGHGGTLEAESTEGVGSVFIITLAFKINI